MIFVPQSLHGACMWNLPSVLFVLSVLSGRSWSYISHARSDALVMTREADLPYQTNENWKHVMYALAFYVCFHGRVKLTFPRRYSLSVTLLITGHFLVYRSLREGHDGGASLNHGLRVGKKRLRRSHVMHPLACTSTGDERASSGANAGVQSPYIYLLTRSHSLARDRSS